MPETTPEAGEAASGSPAGPLVVLVGPPGAGKSTVGAALARRLGVSVTDTDTLVEERAGTTVSEIFLTDGEARFRELEREAVAGALSSSAGVVALGGGAVLDSGTRAVLRGHPVVFLEVSLAAAMPRVGLTGARPLLVGSPRARWKELMDARWPLYQEVARVVVGTDDLDPEQVAQRIIDELALGDAGHAAAGQERTP